jgi:hypothetical protein
MLPALHSNLCIEGDNIWRSYCIIYIDYTLAFSSLFFLKFLYAVLPIAYLVLAIGIACLLVVM